MRLMVLGICSIILLCSCNEGILNKSHHTTLSNSNSCNDEIHCKIYPSKQELESVLENIKPYADIPLRFTVIESVDNKYVLTDFSTTSGETEYKYFIKVVDDVFIIDKIIGRTSVYGITRRFAVTNVNTPLDKSYREVADNFLAESKEGFANEKYKDETIGTYHNLPMQEKRGKIGNTVFYIRYENEEDLINFDMKQIIQCDDDKRTLKDGVDFFIGYDYSDLESEKFIFIKDKLENYHNYEHMKDICASRTLFKD